MTFASVSVVIPCFRCAETIWRAVESVALQTVKPFEVILVDDCSGDETLAALHKIQSSFDEGWIKVIALEKNGGPGTARNAGWAASAQDYIAFLDADDSWHPKKIEIQYRWMLDHPKALLSGHGCDFLALEGCIDTSEDVGRARTKDADRVSRRQLLMSNRFPTRSVMLRRDILFRFKDGMRYCEDYLLWLQIVFFGGGDCYRLPQALSYMHREEFSVGGLSGNLWAMQKGEIFSYLEIHRAGGLGAAELLWWTAISCAKFTKRLLSRSLAK